MVALGIVALMRIFAWDDVEIFAALNTVAAFIYLPAWIVAIVGGLGRRFILAGAAVLIVVAQLVFVLPEFTAAQPVPRWAATAPTIRLLDANVYYQNGSGMSGYAREIKSYDPQLVTMEEATPRLVGQLKASGALAGLPYDEEVSLLSPRAFFVASAYRLSGTHVVYYDGLPLLVETTIDLPSGPQPLWVLHTTAPLPSSFGTWQTELAHIAKLVKERGTHRLLLVGDFNATWGNKGFRSILSDGMTDAAAARGKALDMTWSQLKRPLPPLVRIDHVLTGPGVAATKIRTDAGPGSDHRGLVDHIGRPGVTAEIQRLRVSIPLVGTTRFFCAGQRSTGESAPPLRSAPLFQPARRNESLRARSKQTQGQTPKMHGYAHPAHCRGPRSFNCAMLPRRKK